MKWIDTIDIRNWANRRDCQETLSLLIRKLIRATTISIKSIKFPSGENVLIGGWDGILEVSQETEYLPVGISLWEFGANKDPKRKADEDYAKRTSNPLGFIPEYSTFIFVTPRLWENAENWVEEKRKDGIWKDIKVINAQKLEEWIEIAPTVGAWLAKHIGKYPDGGIQPTDDFWEEWTSGTKFNLTPEILLGGRNKEKERIFELALIPSIISVQGISREESLAFIISCYKNTPDKEEDFFSRSIIVDSIEAFRELLLSEKPLILLPRFEDDSIINRAFQKGHTVFVPLGADATSNWNNKIVLSRLDRDLFVAALMKIGMTQEFAERYSKESTRNIVILRRQLGFTRTLPSWALPENVADIIPALLTGRWDENSENDKKIISQFASAPYENYARKLNKWLHTPDSPLVKIGSTWRLTSPFDAWTIASINLTKSDFESLYKSFIEVLSEVNPAFDLDQEQRHMAAIYGKTRAFSHWIREGIVQSLILTSILGDKLQLDLPLKPEIWVNRIISELLSTDNNLLWKSFENLLPLLAEASPVSFLEVVDTQLKQVKSPVSSLFEEDRGLMMAQTYHTGLLWALESLAWFPQYLSRATLILAKLASIDPGGSTLNRPINSLFEIFKTWHYQTLSPFEERMQVLKLISEREPEIGWKIINSMLPDLSGGVASPTYKTRWRMFELETDKPITYKEIYETHSIAIDMLISIFDFSESKLAKLIEESVNLSPTDRDKILSFVESVISKVKFNDYSPWHSTRNILYHHRSNPDAPWALKENFLASYEKLYVELMPSDELEEITWMFNDHWPHFIDGHQHNKISHEDHEEVILKRRVEALLGLYEKHGLKIVFVLIEKVKESWILGETLSYIVTNGNEISELCTQLNEENNKRRFIHGFINRKAILNGLNWVFKLFNKLKSLGFNNSSLANLFVPLNQNQELWDFIDSTNQEISHNYWERIYPHFFSVSIDEKIYGLKKLLANKRFVSAIHICSHFADEISSNLILEILNKAGIEESDEEDRMDGYDVNTLFETLDKRNDFDRNALFSLEWVYLPLLASYNNNRKPKCLHDELSRNPDFFIEAIKWVYIPENESKINEQKNNLSDEQRKNRARQAYKLLSSWVTIPGVNEAGGIDYDFLKSWISRVKVLANEYGQVEIVDAFIGQVLAQYPEKQDEIWPPVEICQIIEDLKSDDLNRSFCSATINKRGSSVRGPFDGGIIEREIAANLITHANALRNKFPLITGILENIAKGYEEDAKSMDERAERDSLDY